MAVLPIHEREPALQRPAATSASTPCVSCGARVDAPFCAQCGERRASDRDYSVRHLFGEAFEAITNADGTLVRTVRTLVLRPGALTVAWLRGERVGWYGPVRLFLLLNVLYFVWASTWGTRVFDTPLWVHMNRTAHSPVATRLVTERLAERKTTFAVYRPTFDAVATTQAKSLIVLMVPIFAVFVAVLQLRKRRPVVQNLVFALHAYAFVLVLMVASDLVLSQPLQWLVRHTSWRPSVQRIDDMVTLPTVAALALYFAVALRRVDGDGRLVALGKGIALALGVGIALFLYRAILFFTTFWAT